jgi:hypothetical protein
MMIENKKTIICLMRDINPWGFKHLLETLSLKYRPTLLLFNSINKSDELFLKRLDIDYKLLSTKKHIYKLENYLKLFTKSPTTNNYKYGTKRDILSAKGLKKWYFYFMHLILPRLITSNATCNILGLFRTELDNFIKEIDPEFVISFAFLNPIYPIIRAQKLGFRTYIIVYSWDNPFKYLLLPNYFDKYFVWNDQMVSDLFSIHKISKEKQIIIGPIQFDYLRNQKVNILNNNSMTNFALEHSKKYYLYLFSLGYNGSGQEIKLVEHLSKIIQSIDPESLLIARPYPNVNNIEDYNTIKRLPNIKLDDSVIRGLFQDEGTISTKQCLLMNAKAVINLATTMGLEASFYEIPIIQINYIPINIQFSKKRKDRVLDMDYLLKNDHLKKYLFLDFYINVVKSDEEFINVINKIKCGNISTFRSYSNHLRSLADPLKVSATDLLLKCL